MYNHCLYTEQTALNFAARSFCYKITLIWVDSLLNVWQIYSIFLNRMSYNQMMKQLFLELIRIFVIVLIVKGNFS